MLFPHLRLRHKHPCHIGMAVGNASMSLRGVTLYGSKRLHHPYARSRRNPRCYIRTLIVATACKLAAVERHRHNHVHAVENPPDSSSHANKRAMS